MAMRSQLHADGQRPSQTFLPRQQTASVRLRISLKSAANGRMSASAYLNVGFLARGMALKGRRKRALDAQVITWEGRQFRGQDLNLRHLRPEHLKNQAKTMTWVVPSDH